MASNSFNILKIITFAFILYLYPTLVFGECVCDVEAMSQDNHQQEALKYKVIAVASMLVAGALGVSLPLLGKKVPFLRPESDIFFMIKAFAAGVMLATGFVHILPDAFDNLTSPCLGENPWGNFPFPSFVAMMSTIATLMIDSLATGYYKRRHFNSKSNNKRHGDEEVAGEHAGQVHVHAHATHGHAHGSTDSSSQEVALPDLIRKRVRSQVLELGIVVHSVIIGISLGAAESPNKIKPLLAALLFHQLFEGIDLGSCIFEAEYKSRSTAIMTTFFSLTTPVGVAIGFGISSVYKENAPTALIVQGIFNSASAGILIYMALVDLLAADFLNPILQRNLWLQLWANISLLLGAGCMSALVKWKWA